MSNVDRFINSIESPNTEKVVKAAIINSKHDWNGIINYNLIQLENLILDSKPKSQKDITTICYVLSLYAKWLKNDGLVDNDNLYQMIQSMDRSVLWMKAKPKAAQKFISHKKYLEVIHDIKCFEPLNTLYYQALFSCLYEGIYNNDMSVIKNLRGSHIRENKVTLEESNGHRYDLEISSELCGDLIELSQIDTWERKNRYGVFEMKVHGDYPDTVFKLESRNDSPNVKFSYYNKLRKISEEYVEYNLLPMQLYISGIMYRLKNIFAEHDITLQEAFGREEKDRTIHRIISEELKRCNYNNEVRAFREIVKGHIDVFEE